MFAQIVVTFFAVGVFFLIGGMILLCILNRNATSSKGLAKRQIPQLIHKASQESIFLNQETEEALLQLIVALHEKAKEEESQRGSRVVEDHR